EKEEKGRENRHVGAGDDDDVEGAGVAVLLGPHFLELKILTDQEGLHHAGLVIVAVVEPLGAAQDSGAEIHGEFLERRAAVAGEDSEGGGVAGSGPEDVLAGQEAGVIEGAGVAVVAGLADAGVQLDVLAVAEPGKRRAILGIERDLGASVGLEFEEE